MTKVAKLDMYDVFLLPGIILVKLTRINDPILVDIMSDIHNSDNRIHVDGHYYKYNDRYEIVRQHNDVYLELHVTETKIQVY